MDNPLLPYLYDDQITVPISVLTDIQNSLDQMESKIDHWIGKFHIYDDFLCKRKRNGLKYMISLESFTDKQKNNIIETLNNNYKTLAIQKIPFEKKLTILINNLPYLEHYWNQDTHKYIVSLYSTKNKKIIIKDETTSIQKSNWINLFDDCNLVEYNPNHYYIIKYEKNECILYINGQEKVANADDIFEEYNLFDARMIGVDFDSFCENGFLQENRFPDWEKIKETIISQYQLSYIKKILLKRNLQYSNLYQFITSCFCELLDEQQILSELHDEYYLLLKDNIGKEWKIHAYFDERDFDEYEPYYSSFTIK